MIKVDRRKLSGYLLILGMMYLIVGIATHITAFSWLAVVCILISLTAGGKWMRPRRK